MLRKAVTIMLDNLCEGRLHFLTPDDPSISRYIPDPGEQVTQYGYPLHNHNYAEIVQLIEGNAHLNLAHDSIRMDGQRARMILPKTIHGEGVVSVRKPYKLLWTVITPTGFNLFISVYTPENGFQIHAERLYGLTENLDELLQLVHQPSLVQNKLTQAKFQALMIQLSLAALSHLDSPPASQPDYHQVLIGQVREYINQHFHEELTINELAQMARCTPNYLNGLFRKHTGLPIHQYILQKRLNAAKQLLQEKNTSVKEVAYKLGFRDPLYFSRLFRKRFGVPPSKLTP